MLPLGSYQERAFLALKEALVNAPVLAMPVDGEAMYFTPMPITSTLAVFCNIGKKES